MSARFLIILILLHGAGAMSIAQEQPTPLVQRSGVSLLTQEQHLLLAYPSEFVVLGFRRYDIGRFGEAMQPVLDLWGGGIIPEQSRATSKDIRMAPAMSLDIPLGSEAVQLPGFATVGRFVLMEALRFGYQYFRESTRRSSLSDFDYLELPRGTGIFRTSGDVVDEALRRGEIQSQKTHQDTRTREKNSGAGTR